jgi:hypothetical protein
MAASSTSTVKKGKGKHRRVVTSDPESDEDDRIQAKAAPFPLAKTFFNDPGGSKPPRTAGPSRPRRKPRKVYTELESDDDDAGEGIQGKVAPFPLGPQFFHDADSSVTARRLMKRLSNKLDSDGDSSPRERYKSDVRYVGRLFCIDITLLSTLAYLKTSPPMKNLVIISECLLCECPN